MIWKYWYDFQNFPYFHVLNTWLLAQVYALLFTLILAQLKQMKNTYCFDFVLDCNSWRLFHFSTQKWFIPYDKLKMKNSSREFSINQQILISEERIGRTMWIFDTILCKRYYSFSPVSNVCVWYSRLRVF